MMFVYADVPLVRNGEFCGRVSGVGGQVVANVSEFDDWKLKLVRQIQMCAPNAVAASKSLVRMCFNVCGALG